MQAVLTFDDKLTMLPLMPLPEGSNVRDTSSTVPNEPAV
jgi:hypothetical protein